MKKTSLYLAAIPLAALLLATTAKPDQSLKDMKKTLKTGYAYIPSGKTLVDKDTVSCRGFFMLKGEVTNGNYLEYLNDLWKQNRKDEWKAALPDTSRWVQPSFSNSAFAAHYFRHPAYRDYPVVNLNRSQATHYCEWLTSVWRKNTGNMELVFRIPTRAEFLRAANGEAMNRPYSWNGPYIRNSKGAYLCNHLAFDNRYITRDTTTGELQINKFFPDDQPDPTHDITAPSISYYPNEYGLYNLNGNVAEMVSDAQCATGGSWFSPGYDVRNQSIMPFHEASPFIGFRPVMTFLEKK